MKYGDLLIGVALDFWALERWVGLFVRGVLGVWHLNC
jgi:hypothetical protein